MSRGDLDRVYFSMQGSRRSMMPIRIRPLHGEDGDLLGRSISPSDRVAMMWPLALDAWAFKGEPVRELRLPRHIVRVLRGGR
jgi:hypothetical protein